MAPPPLSPPLCILPPGSGPPRFVCYCEPESSRDGDGNGFSLYVTDAVELWSTSFSPDSLATLKARFGLSGTEDISSRFRAACQQQAVTVSLQEDRALMTLSGDTSALAFDLSKVPSSEAAAMLQALTLSLAERVYNLEKRLAASEETTTSPRKTTHPAGSQLFLPELDHQRASSGLGVRKRCPGESLINPGFKRYLPHVFPPPVPSLSSVHYIFLSSSKKPAGGVDFDET